MPTYHSVHQTIYINKQNGWSYKLLFSTQYSYWLRWKNNGIFIKPYKLSTFKQNTSLSILAVWGTFKQNTSLSILAVWGQGD